MDSFPFTKSKFLSMPESRRHKWINKWLRAFYIDIQNNQISDASLNLFLQNYIQIQKWLGFSNLPLTKPKDKREWLELISNTFHTHQKLTGLGLSESNLLPKIITGDSDKPWKPKLLYKVALDNLRSAFNVGSIFRLIDAVGFESVVMSEKTPGKENLQVKKTAMSSSEWVPEEKGLDLANTLEKQKLNGYHIIGVETVKGSTSYLDFPWPKKGIVVVGNEEYGLSNNVLKTCQNYVHLPMSGKKNSINVANAFAVVAFHICSLKLKYP